MMRSYSVKEHYELLKSDVEKFKATDVKLSGDKKIDEEDAKYQASLSATLLQVADHGIQSQSLSRLNLFNIPTIANHIHQGEQLLQNPPFDADCVPQIKGPKSLSFIETVYLPYVKRLSSKQVEFSTADTAAAAVTSKSIGQRIKDAEQRAFTIEVLIESYKISLKEKAEQKAKLSSSGMFASSSSSASSSAASSLDVDLSRLSLNG